MKGCYLEKWFKASSVLIALFSPDMSAAQVVGDTTLPTGERSQVTGNPNFQIDGGATRGGNLFHSFSDFSVPTGGTAFFNNAIDVQNILTRVTGGAISNIDGMIRANGTANLFLINPNGIIFGPNASLNIGGSFVGSTASSIQFADSTEFSAVNPSAPPLLTISVPVGLQFNGTEGDIVVQGSNQTPAPDNPFIEVGDADQLPGTAQPVNSPTDGTTFNAISGNLDNGNDVDLYQLFLTEGQPFTASTVNGTQVDTQLFLFDGSGLGLSSNDDSASGTLQSTVPLNEPFMPTASGTYYLGISSYNNDPLSSQGYIFDASGEPTGSGSGLPLSEWDANNGFGSGAYTITITLQPDTSIMIPPDKGLQVQPGRTLALVGGNVTIQGGNLQALGGRVELGGLAGGGTVGLNGDGNNLSLSFPNGVERSDIFLSNGAQVNVIASDGGSIAVNARNLEMTGESGLYAGIDSGLGSENSKAGNIAVNATGAINLNDKSQIYSRLLEGAEGQGGDVSISASILRLEGGAQVDAITLGVGKAGSLSVDAQDVQLIGTSADGRFPSALGASALPNSTGDAGDLTIKTNTLLVRDEAQVSTSTWGSGKGGDLRIDAQDVQIIGTTDSRQITGLFASAQPNSTGDAGDLTIKTNTLLVRDRAQIVTTTFGLGKGGDLMVDAQDVQLIGTSGLFASTEPNSTGDAGDLTINTNTLLVRDGAQVSTSTSGLGKGGDLMVDAQDVQLIRSTNDRKSTGLFASAQQNSTGDAGDLTINTNTLLVRDGAQVSTSTFGLGKGGDLMVDAQDVQLIGTSPDGQFSSALTASAEPNSTGDAGDLTINTNTLLVRDGAQVATGTFGSGNGGSLRIDAQDVQLIGTYAVDLTSSGLFASAQQNSTGDAGDLTINTNTLLVRDGAVVTVQSLGTGTAGNLEVDANQIYLNNTGEILADTSGGGGNIDLRSPLIVLRNGSNITTNARGSNNPGGDIDINTDNLVAVPSENSDISANSEDFRGGKVTITASGIFGIEFREQLTPLSDITATGVSEEFSGTVELITPGIDPARGLAQLPTEVVDATDAIAQGCPANEGNSFVVTGRGGLPPNPEQQLDDDAEWLDRRRLTVAQQTNPGTEGSQQHSEGRLDTPHSAHHPPLIEATGWEMAPTGQVILTASVPNVTPSNRWGQPVNCDRS